MSIPEILCAAAFALSTGCSGTRSGTDATPPMTMGKPAVTPPGANTMSKDLPALPPAVDEATDAGGPCGGFEGAAEEPTLILKGRLSARFVRGLRAAGPGYSFIPVDPLFGLSEVFFVKEGEREIAVVADELLARVEASDPGAQLAELFAAVERLAPMGSTVRPLRSEHLPSVEVEPARPEIAGSGLLVLTAYTVGADRTVLRLRFHVSAATPNAGCASLARRMARTLSAGGRTLTRTAGTVTLPYFEVDAPSGYVLLKDHLPNGSIARLERLGTLEGPRARVVVYFGQEGLGVPFPFPAPDAARARRPFLGRDAEWRTWAATEDGSATHYQRVALSGVLALQGMAIAGFATTDEGLASELTAILASVRLKP